VDEVGKNNPTYLLLTPPDERPDEGGLKDLEMEGPENDLYDGLENERGTVSLGE
jgi:hypothetical protein